MHAPYESSHDAVPCLVGSFSGSSRMRNRRRSCSSSGLVWCPTPLYVCSSVLRSPAAAAMPT